jgi:hypothetical protein
MRWLGRRVGDAAQLSFPAVKPRRPGAPAVRHWGSADFGDEWLIGSRTSSK